MPPLSYARPRLITASDKRYREHVERFVLQRQNQRAMRPPRQRDIFGQQAENALREWLAAQLELAETRILEYEERRGTRAHTKYRELDALLLEPRRMARVFEIKASRTAGSLRRAARQLSETRQILRLLLPTVYTTILLVDTGIPTTEEVADLLRGEEPPERPPETLEEVFESMPQLVRVSSLDERPDDADVVDVLAFGVDDIIALAGAENLALDWEADDAEEEAPAAPAPPTLSYSSEETPDDDDDGDADNPLAAALRRAGLSND
jgi:PAS domain-containing protein